MQLRTLLACVAASLLGSALDAQTIALKYAEFDPRVSAPSVPEDLSARPMTENARGYWLVQVAGPITAELRDALALTGAELLDFVPSNAFTVRATPAVVAQLDSLPQVLWIGPYHPAYRIDPALIDSHDDLPRRMVVHAFPVASGLALEAELESQGLVVLEGIPVEDRWLFVVLGTAAAARHAARVPDVHWIEPEGVLEQRNDTTRWVIQTNLANNTKVWNLGIHGENQVIGHIDGPIRASSCFFSDPVNPIGPLHRKLVYYDGSGSDTHGTHTAGTAAGDAQPINGSTSARGMAYAARLAHTAGMPFANFDSVVSAHHAAGARMHTNSWGDDTITVYNTLCQQIDLFQWNNEDDLVFFATSDTSRVKNPENAKNLVAVGATLPGIFAHSRCSGGAGPTADGRRKPDIMVPGCDIVSAGSGACTTVTLSGTSMASPAAAGAGALVRQYFQDGFYPTGAPVAGDGFDPSGALVKAILVNSAQDMAGILGYPSDLEGWGRVNLDESLQFTGDASKLFVDDVRRAQGLSTGQSVSYEVTVTSNASPLEFTLCFTDFPGNVAATNPVVNDLDLVVTAPNGSQYKGNVFAANQSTTGGVADVRNNVERVAFNNPATGTYQIAVNATNIVQGPSGYALVVNGRFQLCNPAVTLYCTPKAGLSCGPSFISAFGNPSATAGSGFFVSAFPAEQGKVGLMLYSDAGPANIPFDGGILCVSPPIRRTTTVSSGNFGACQGEFVLDMNSFAVGALGGNPANFLTVPGTQVNAQFWGRDTVATGSLLSDGVQYTVCD